MGELGVFGYGSLVHPGARPPNLTATPAVLAGWRRQWAHRLRSPLGNACTLTVVPREGTTLRGVLLAGRDGLLAELDAREVGHERREVTVQSEGQPPAARCFTYVSNERHYSPASSSHPIWRSYLDCVLAGYYELDGERAVIDFVESTDWFEAPILDDRDDPRYPRAVTMSPERQRELDARMQSYGLLANLIR